MCVCVRVCVCVCVQPRRKPAGQNHLIQLRTDWFEGASGTEAEMMNERVRRKTQIKQDQSA